MDLPSQQELLAQFRCDEMISELFANFSQQTSGLATTGTIKSGKFPENFKSDYESVISKYISLFQEKAERYNRSVVQKKEVDFKEHMISFIKPIYFDALKILYKKSIQAFRVAFEKDLSADDPSLCRGNQSFWETAENSKKLVIEGFHKVASQMILNPKENEWDFNSSSEELSETINSVISLKKSELSEMIKLNICKEFRESFTEAVSLKFELDHLIVDSFWGEIQAIYESITEEKLVRLITDFKGTYRSIVYFKISLFYIFSVE